MTQQIARPSDMTASAAERSPSARLAALALIVVLTLCAGMFAGGVLSQWRSTDELTVARKNADESLTEEAIVAYRRHLSGSPNDSTVRLELAMLLQRRDPVGALFELRQVSPGTPEHVVAARYLASLSMTLGRDYDAIGPLEFLESQLPGDVGVQQSLAEIFFRQHEFDKSLDRSKRLRQLKPDSIEACLLIAECNDHLGRQEGMIEPLEAALRLNDDLPQAHLNLAYAYEAAGRADESILHVRWYLSRFPASVAAHRILATVERSRDHFEEALAAALAGRKLAPKNLELAILAADLQLYLRRPDDAYESLNELVVDWPRERRLLAPLLRAAALCRKTERADELKAILRQIDAKE